LRLGIFIWKSNKRIRR